MRKRMREKIILRGRARPKQIKLSNGDTFAARYKRSSRQNLPKNVS